ncbi:hypothetical protein Tco_0721940 [Tanacetum coccineum]
MAISVISVSLDYLEESVGTSTARVILFGKIPTAIPAAIHDIDLPIVRDDTPLIPTETPTIPPIAPTLPYISLFMYTDSFDSDSSDRPLSPTHGLPPTDATPPTHQILSAPPRLPLRPAVLVLLGQPIPFGRPYRTQPNGVHSSSGSSSSYSLDTSSCYSLPDTSFNTPAVTETISQERIRDSDAAFDQEYSAEGSYETYIEPDIDSDVQADIDACIKAADAAATKETDVGVEDGIGIKIEDEDKEEAESSDRGTTEIGVDRVIKSVVSDDVYELAIQRITEIESVQAGQGYEMFVAYEQRAVMSDRIVVLERYNMRLRAMLYIERERIDHLRRHMAYNQEELRQIRRFCYYDHMEFRRLENYARRCLGYYP